MKRIFTLFASLLALVSASAQLNGDGYYRVKNAVTGRYIYIIDDKSNGINWSTSNPDLYSITLWKGFEKAASDPATIIYIKDMGGGQYNLLGQGADIYTLSSGSYIKLRANSDGTYYAYATKSGATKYLSDGERGSSDDGVLSVNNNDTRDGDYRKWYIEPVTVGDKYFGLNPMVEIDGRRFAPLYASFPVAAVSPGMKVCYISKVGAGMAAFREAADAKLPASTAVLVECAAPDAASNRMEVGENAASVPDVNLLAGTYFNNPAKNHYNRVEFDPKTMRVFGLTSDGKPGYVSAGPDFIPANQSYLIVPEGTAAELRLVTEDEFDEAILGGGDDDPNTDPDDPGGGDDPNVDPDDPNGGDDPNTDPDDPDASLTDVSADTDRVCDIYGIDGILVKKNATAADLRSLPAGLYIISGKKILVN